MPLIEIQDDEVGDAIKLVNDTDSELSAFIADRLTRVIERISPIQEAFFTDPRVGNKGASILLRMHGYISSLAHNAAERLNSVLMRAGDRLTPNEDGTVTYTPPPPPVEQPQEQPQEEQQPE